jgi:hypothetical protein
MNGGSTNRGGTIQVNTFPQGCQMVYFQTKNPNLGIFWRVLEWKRLVYSLAVWNKLQPFT